MPLVKSMFLGAAFLIGASVAANAQAQYQPYPYPSSQPYPYSPPTDYRQVRPSNQVPAVPPSWYYNPYTSGFTPDPNRSNGS